jgi:aminoglycoside phosphotransferase (APT) family kinase protein
VTAFAQARGLRVDGARVLHHYNSSVVLLPADDLVVRLTENPSALARMALSQAVCTWLIETKDFPATQPFAGLPPTVIGNTLTASFWRYHHPAQPTVEPTSSDLARLLRRLHDVGTPPFELATWSPLTSLAHTLRTDQADAVLTSTDREWLTTRVHELRLALAECDWPLGSGLIHGDAWAGNLLSEHHPLRPLIRLGDWDNVSFGPREVDLIPTWHASYRYGKGPLWRTRFQQIYGYDLQSWSGFPLLMAMRDLVQLSGPIRRAAPGNQFAAVLAQRLGDIRAGVVDTVWTAL